MPNRLAQETSPYLLQHAGNPVDWHPWGPEALERAKTEDKPIFLSIGYSACHWCHVMEHESFENRAIAALLNAQFVCIKVDREERPDLDQIYMQAVQLMTGRGGWPMSVFLTPALEPFYGGTYWPPHDRQGMPGFDRVLTAVADAWHARRDQLFDQARTLTEHLQSAAAPASESQLGVQHVVDAAGELLRLVDRRHGGFGGAPKFPHPMDLQLLLRVWSRTQKADLLEIVTLTLDKMAGGGIYDHLGGGFHRYSVDERWLVPHFEKMLYDNALLLATYVEGFQATGEPRYARVARETADYVLRDLTDSAGGFHSTEDADSEGEEGKFYVWTPRELEQVLGAERARTFGYCYDVSEPGNFEGHNILNLPKTVAQCAKVLGRDEAELEAELAASRAALLAVRGGRVRPGLDDKVLVSWNGLMIDALARAARPLDEPRYLAAAEQAARFILEKMRRADGRLLHTYRAGRAHLDAYLDDYACLAGALVSLYEAGFDERWIVEALGLVDVMLAQFRDPATGGFFYTAADHEALLLRPQELMDNATPSASSMAATALVRLAKLTGRDDLREAAEQTLQASAGVIDRSATAAGQALLALDLLVGPTHEIVVLGEAASGPTLEALTSLAKRYLPRKLVACRESDENAVSERRGSPPPSPLDPLFAGKSPLGDEPTVFICENFACQAPVAGLASALAKWQQLR
ncbi:MAG: thioredoxin domain-containing protein [Pirellulales bacterium]